jgi:voltage-dependent potassium channel beta subunit
MRTRALGRSGLQVSEIALGSWLTLGSRVDHSETARLLHQAFDLGVNFFDTADVYAQGEAEQAVGDALKSLPRHHVVLATKCFFPMSEHPNDRGLSRKHIFESVEGSLRRLRTEYIDLHQCHRPDETTPIEETVRAYEDLIRQGKVLYWGVSEWSAAKIEEACGMADFHGGYRPISNQPQYSIMRRQIEGGVLETSEREGLGQIVFSPLGQGALTGKYSGGQVPAQSRGNDPKRNLWMNDYLSPDALARVDQLRPIADEIGISMAQLALAWCLRSPSVSSVIIGATRAEQLEENVKAAGVKLSEDVLARIDLLFPGPDSPGPDGSGPDVPGLEAKQEEKS